MQRFATICSSLGDIHRKGALGNLLLPLGCAEWRRSNQGVRRWATLVNRGCRQCDLATGEDLSLHVHSEWGWKRLTWIKRLGRSLEPGLYLPYGELHCAMSEGRLSVQRAS